MTRSGTHHSRKNQHDNTKQQSLPSSQGDSPVGVTPMDISSDDASARDLRARPVNSDNAEEHNEAVLDEAVELTFPASDPIAPSSVTRIEKPASKDKPSRK